MSAAPATMPPARRAQLLVAIGAIPPAVVIGAILLLVSPVVAVVAFVVVAAGIASWLWWGGERLVLSSFGGRPADPRTEARLLNLIDGLCSTAGVRQPTVLVAEHAGLNLAVAGRSPDRAVLTVTTGLLAGLSRIELEGVLADGLVQIRRGDIVAATVAVAAFGLGGRFVAGHDDHDEEIDRAGVALTRYPPALVSAFETMQRLGTTIEGVRPSMAHLWLVDPRGAPASASGGVSERGASGPGARRTRRPALSDRVAALRQL